MPMTVVVTSAVRDRFRGFLASCMCEIAPGVYTSPKMNAAVRERVWSVAESWFDDRHDGSVVMTWPDPKQLGGLAVWSLGAPRTEVARADGVYLARRDVPETPESPPE